MALRISKKRLKKIKSVRSKKRRWPNKKRWCCVGKQNKRQNIKKIG